MKTILHTVLFFAFTFLVLVDGASQAVGDKYEIFIYPMQDEVKASFERSDKQSIPNKVGLSTGDEVKIVKLKNDGNIYVEFTFVASRNADSFWKPHRDKKLYFKIDKNSFSRLFRKIGRSTNPSDTSAWRETLRQEILLLRSKKYLIKDKDLTDLLRKETAFALTGKDDASVLTPFASLSTENNSISVGVPFEVHNRTFFAPKATAKLSKETKDITLSGSNVGKDISLGFRASHFLRGFLKNKNRTTSISGMYKNRLQRLSNNTSKYQAEYIHLKSKYASSSKALLKDTLTALTKAQEKLFWKEDLGYFLKNSTYRKLRTSYIFIDFESALGDKNLIYRDSLESSPRNENFLAFSGGVGVGQVYRGARYRLNWTTTFGFQNVSNATTGKLPAKTISTIEEEVDSLTSRIKQSTEYFGIYKEKAEMFVGCSLLWYFANTKFDSESNIEVGVKGAARYIVSDVKDLREEDARGSIQAGLILSIRDKDGKPSIVLYPHADRREGEFSFRLSAGVPF